MSNLSDLRVVAPLFALALSACTGVTVINGDGSVHVSRHLLTVGVTMDDAAASRIVRAEGVGLFTSPLGVSIGAHRTEVAAFAVDDCRAVFWVESRADAAALRDRADAVETACRRAMGKKS